MHCCHCLFKICVEWLHSKAFGGPQQTPANVPSLGTPLANRASTITHSACAAAVTHTLHPANQSLGRSLHWHTPSSHPSIVTCRPATVQATHWRAINPC